MSNNSSTLDKKKIWIDLEDPDKETLNTYIKKFDLDSKAVEQYIIKSKKPQIRVLDNHTFTVLLNIQYKSLKLATFTEGIYLFCGKDGLITIHSDKMNLADSIKRLLEEKKKKIMQASIEALYYSIITELIDRYEQVLTAVELTLTDLEEKSLSDPSRATLSFLDTLSRQIIVFRRHFWRIRDVVNFLTHIEEDKDEIRIR